MTNTIIRNLNIALCNLVIDSTVYLSEEEIVNIIDAINSNEKNKLITINSCNDISEFKNNLKKTYIESWKISLIKVLKLLVVQYLIHY